MITPNPTWHTPLNVYWHLKKLTDEVGAEAIERERKYQLVREARVGAVVALSMFRRMGKPSYIQLFKPDPPDVILMQQNMSTGERDITQLEITTFLTDTKEPLVDLIKRKDPPGTHKYSDNYIVVVNIGKNLTVDYNPSRDYLNQNDAPFPVWAVQETSAHPDTIAKVTIINPEIHEMEINLGEAAHTLNQVEPFGVIHSKRTGNPLLVRAEMAEKNYAAPWETIGR